MEDVTKTGPIGLKGLNGINEMSNREYETLLSSFTPLQSSQYQQIGALNTGEDKYFSTGINIGTSMFDSGVYTPEEISNARDVRAENQPWIAKLGAGLTKGVALAGTTFIDGTLGLISGVGESIGTYNQGSSAKESISKLWNNEISNSLSSLNEYLEEALPNYRTQEELDNPWYKNIGTMNFWADGVIKNMGFTVGAFYSGSAWTKALKAANILQGSMGAKVTGSLLSALNEGRIEANHTANDVLELEYKKIHDFIQDKKVSIGLPEDFDMSFEEEELRKDARDRVNSIGLTTLIGNTVLLTLNNFDTFGKLYARGFKNSRTITGDITKKSGEYIYNPITKKRAIAKGIKHGIVEGNEEMAQAFISETAGLTHSPDSPNTYYEAILDQKAEAETKDFLKSVTEGFVNTYGNGDRWEEFAVGAFTGILGIPTFGKVQNSDANTWLGKGKSVGISGGLLGEFKEANRQNQEGTEAVNFMNNYVKMVQEQTNHFIRSQSFTNSMDGWAESKDAFEYKNADNNSDFSAISRFASIGRLGDLREMINQDFENISDDELENIAAFTSPKDGIGGWRNTDGSLMSSTKEGRAEMREELSKKRDRILSEVDRYESSIETVRAIGNNSLNEDQVNELAWLNWKVGMFTDRYNSVKEENREFLIKLYEGIQTFKSGMYRDVIDERTEEGSNILASMDNAEKFIEALQSSKSPLQLATLMEANPHITEFIEELGYLIIEDVVGIDASNFEKSIRDLKDTIRIAKAAKSFNQRYKEFRDNPIKLIENRDNILKKKEKTIKAINSVNLKDKVSNSSVSDIVKGIENNNLDISELDGLFSEEDNGFLNNIGNEGEVSIGKQKVEEAKKIIQTYDRANNALSSLEDESIDPQAIEDARTLLKHSKLVSESEQEMLGTATQAYNDPSLLYEDGDSSMQGISQEEIASVLNERLDAAKSIIEQAKSILAEENNELEDLPSSGEVERRFTVEEAKGTDKGTGHDTTVKVMSENERRKEEEKKEKKKKETEALKGRINDFFNEAKQEVALENKETFDKALSEVINNIDMLLAKETPILELGKAIKNTESYKTLEQLVPTIDEFLNVYVTSKTKKSTISKQIEDNNIKTPIVNEEVVRRQTTEQMKEDSNKEKSLATYQYWKPTISYLPFGKTYLKGDTTPFYIIARSLKNTNGTPVYTEAQLRRIEAVGKYLEEHGAFKLVDSGEVKAGDKVSFTIDSTLNDTAGEIVILMSDSQGRIIGDIMSQNDASFQKQTYLPAFVEKVVQEYKDAGYPQYFTSSLTTVVAKNMVGKIPYLADHEEMNTINDIHSDGNTPIPFLIGVAASSGSNVRVLASAGRTKKQGQSDLERSINPPLVAKAGQPFLLMPTSSTVNHYMPVPIMMDPYSPSTQGTALGQAIHKVLERVTTADNSSAIDIIRDLEELISVQEIHINYSGDNVKVTIKPNGTEHQMTIYNGTKNAPNIVEQLELGLQGQPFQVSRKYMNEDYNGQDYNRMVGEVAKTNLPIGATHTVSDWFTLKPIDESGNITKAKSPRSTGRNPHAAELPVITLTMKGMQLQVNPKTWEVSDGKKTYEGQNADKARALAFGIYTNQNMEQPYNTEWGYYDPTKDEFVEEPNKVLRTSGVTQPTRKEITYTPEQLRDKAKTAGLLGNKVRESLWEMLTPTQQSLIVDKKGPKQRQLVDALEGAWTPTGFDESKLKGSVDDFLGRKGMYRRTDGSRSVWNRERETQWLSKVLPNLSTEEHLRIVEGVERIPTHDGGYAYGKFQEGVITLAGLTTRGTMYHEAFHAVTHTLLSPQEYKELFNAAKEKWGNLSKIALEENLAEDFRRYIQLEETPIVGTAVKIYRTLKHLIQNLLGKEPYINKLYYNINRGKFANRTPSKTTSVRYKTDPYEIQRRIENLTAHYNRAKALINSARNTDKSIIDSIIEDSGLSDVLYSYQQNGNGKWSIARIKKETFDSTIKTLQDQLASVYESELSEDEKLSRQMLEEQDEAYYRRIEQYHRDKLLFDNLSQEDKSYLQERGISDIEYKDMTQLERKVLFKCKY